MTLLLPEHSIVPMRGVYFGDLRLLGPALPDHSIDLIFTDPPYVRESLPACAALAPLAARVLKPTGFLVFYIGTFYKAYIYEAMRELEFFWEFSIIHKSAPMVWSRNLLAKHKSVLAFRPSGGSGAISRRMIDVYNGGESSKQFHKWGQSYREAAYFVEGFSRPGNVVLDPFSGGGTTAVVCERMDREWVAFDVDRDAVNMTRSRASNPFFMPQTNGQLSFEFTADLSLAEARS